MIMAGLVILIISLDSIGGRIEWLWVQGFSLVRDVIGAPRV
jgi:flagellar biosynthetic protein FliR